MRAPTEEPSSKRPEGRLLAGRERTALLGRLGIAAGWVLVVMAAAASLPVLAERPGTGLDPSWRLAFHLCQERGLVVGRDTLYTYGPWGFLVAPLVLVRWQWLAAVGWALGGHLALMAALALWMRRVVAPRLAWLAPLSLLVAAPPQEYELPLAVLLAAVLAVGSSRQRPLVCAFIGAAAASAMLVKTGPGLVAAVVVVGAAAAVAWAGRWRVAVALVGGWVAGLALLASLALGSPALVPGWLHDTLEIATAYGVAMQRGGPSWQPWFVATAVLLLGVAAAAARSAARHCLPLLAPAAGVVLLAFRHAFNRQQTHFAIAFTVTAALGAWVALALAGAGPVWWRRARAGAAVALGVVAAVVVPGAGVPHPIAVVAARAREVRDALRTLGDPGSRAAMREQLRGELPLGESVLAQVKGRSVDVMTMEIAVVEAWDLDWRPRPVLQSYLASTARLDAMDAGFLAGPRAPQRLLVELFGVDTRHPIWDDPLTWRVIARYWEPVAWDRRWLVLARRDHPRGVEERPLGTLEAVLNQPFSLPSPERGHLELRLRLEPTLLGRLVGAVWKVPEVRLCVVAPVPQPCRRIVARTVRNPFPVLASPVETPADLVMLLSAPGAPAPTMAKLICGGPWAWRRARVEAWQVEWKEVDGNGGGGLARVVARAETIGRR